MRARRRPAGARLGFPLFPAVFAVFAGVADAPAAERLVDDKPLLEFLNSKPYVEALTRYIARYESDRGPCPKPKVTGRVNTFVLSAPLKLPGAGNTPQWVEVLRVEGCPRVFERKVFATRLEGKRFFQALVLGNSRTNPVLQRNVAKSLLLVERAFAEKAGCAKDLAVRILGAKFVSKAGTDWKEDWLVANCKGLRRLAVKFKASPRGDTDYVIKQPEVTKQAE